MWYGENAGLGEGGREGGGEGGVWILVDLYTRRMGQAFSLCTLSPRGRGKGKEGRKEGGESSTHCLDVLYVGRERREGGREGGREEGREERQNNGEGRLLCACVGARERGGEGGREMKICV